MPTRQRGSKEEGKKQATPKDEERRSGHAFAPPGEPKRREKKVKWSPVFKRMGYIALLLIVPALLNYAAISHETRVLVAKAGTLYDIGWRQRLMLHCMGEGLPTVILEAPIGESSVVWSLVQPLIAKRTKVCVYDRAGIGLSDSAYANTSEYANDFSEAAKERDRTKPSTVERMVDDLHRLVTYSSNQPKPLLLVSTDFATFISRFYTQFYGHHPLPQTSISLVKLMIDTGVLLHQECEGPDDPAVESLFDVQSDGSQSDGSQSNSKESHNSESQPQFEGSLWAEYWYTRAVPHMQSVQMSASLGFSRIGLMLGLMTPVEEPDLQKILPEEVITKKKHLLCQPKHLSSASSEYYFMNVSMDQIKTMFHVKPFPKDLPITIATYRETNQNVPPELMKVWSEGQSRLHESIHPQSRLTTLPGSDYLTLYYNARSVANTVLSMVEEWRKDYKLAA